jgi:hypothetical protein
MNDLPETPDVDPEDDHYDEIGQIIHREDDEEEEEIGRD